MLHTDERFAEAVEQAVTRIEKTTDAEIVVVAAGRSGSYRDLSLLAGVGAAWVALVFVLWSPFSFGGSWLPLELPVIGAAVAVLVDRSPGVLRRLATRARRCRQVEAAAAQVFHEEAVNGTRGRTGLLVYVSALEDRVVVLPDAGLDARIPRARWNELRWGRGADPRAPGALDAFVAGLDAAGAVLASHLPPTGDNPDEIANAPRIRS